MAALTDIDLVRCVVIGNEESNLLSMMKKYAEFVGVPFNALNKELITAFNGQKCVFKAVSTDGVSVEDPHVFLLCVSIACQENAEEIARMILDTVVERIRDVPFVFVGTQIDKRLSMFIENYGCGQAKYMPMPLNQAELFAKRIGAKKYLECSEVTGSSIHADGGEDFYILKLSSSTMMMIPGIVCSSVVDALTEMSNIFLEGLEEVFEEAFEIGQHYAIEQLRGYRRKISITRLQKDRKLSCITQ